MPLCLLIYTILCNKNFHINRKKINNNLLAFQVLAEFAIYLLFFFHNTIKSIRILSGFLYKPQLP